MKITFHILIYIYISITLFLNFTTGLVYASDHLDHLDHQELTEVFEFCHTNQASDLCNLLGQEVLDYQNQPTYKDYDLSFNESISNYEHFAHAAFAVSVPAFLKYLPALANLAKNNMIFASAALLVAGAVGFKTYYDSLYDNLILTDKSVKINSFDESRIIELQSSKRYQYYSKKGPEHEENTLIPFVRKQNRKKHEGEMRDNSSFLSYLKNHKGEVNEEYPSSDNHPHLKKMTTELISSLENYKPPRSLDLKEVPELKTQEFVPGVISYVSFDFSKPNAISDFSKPEKLLAEKAAVRFFDMAKYSSIISTSQFLELRFYLKNRGDNYAHPAKYSFWKALLLEHVAHLELLAAKKNPEFEKNIYLPFLVYELDILKTQMPVIGKNLVKFKKIVKSRMFLNGVYKLREAKFTPIPHISEIPNIPESNSKYSQRLLPAQYSLDFNYNLDYYRDYYYSDELYDYLAARSLMLIDLVSVVANRVNIYNRERIFQYLPGEAQSKQAYDDWIELFELSTNPLLYDLFKLADVEAASSTVLDVYYHFYNNIVLAHRLLTLK